LAEAVQSDKFQFTKSGHTGYDDLKLEALQRYYNIETYEELLIYVKQNGLHRHETHWKPPADTTR